MGSHALQVWWVNGWLRIPIERMVVHEECTLHLCSVLNGVKTCCRLLSECDEYIRFGFMSIFRTGTYSASPYNNYTLHMFGKM